MEAHNGICCYPVGVGAGSEVREHLSRNAAAGRGQRERSTAAHGTAGHLTADGGCEKCRRLTIGG
jgi:hypothetical protein